VLSDRFYIPEKVVPYHILSIEGEAKGGKTYLAATAPKKVAFQSLNFGTDGVLQEWDDFRERFVVAEYSVNFNPLADAAQQAMSGRARNKKAADKEEIQKAVYAAAEEQADRVRRESLEPFKQDYYDLLDDDEIKTIVWDKATEVNELVRLAHHGKLERNPRIAYGPINSEFKGMVKKASERRKNLILIHDLTDVYVNDEPSGRRKMKGNGNIEEMVHSFVKVAKKVEKGVATFTTTVRDSRFAPAATGEKIEMATWAELMMVLMPNIDPEVWLDD
jgi:hypothetical protein